MGELPWLREQGANLRDRAIDLELKKTSSQFGIGRSRVAIDTVVWAAR